MMANGPPGSPPTPGGYGYGPPAPPGGEGYGYAPPPPAAGFGQAPHGAPNPYSAPQALGGVGGLSTPGGAMKWLFMAGYAGFWVLCFVAGIVSGALQAGGKSTSAELADALPVIGIPALVLVPISALVWLYKSWACVPPDMRYSDGGKWVTPGGAVGLLFVPFYNLYWVFVANVGLCDALNRALARCGAPARAPRALAIAACIVHLVPYCNILAGPIVWTVYMFMVDGAKKELVDRTGILAY